jgi:hypothetical protein
MIYYDIVIWGDGNYSDCYPAIIMMVFHTSASFQHFHENVSLFEGLFNDETNHTVKYTILNYGS